MESQANAAAQAEALRKFTIALSDAMTDLSSNINRAVDNFVSEVSREISPPVTTDGPSYAEALAARNASTRMDRS